MKLLTGKGRMKAAKGTVRGFLMSPHPITNFEMYKYYQMEPKFYGVYSRNNLSKIKDDAYVINLDEYKSIRTHWIALYVTGNIGRASHDAV